MKEFKKTCIIIPCYNEEKRISSHEFLTFANNNPSYSLLFVDDGSTDNTKLVLKDIAKSNQNISVLFLPKNKGKSGAIREAYLHIADAGFSYIGFFDADLSTPLNASIQMYDLLAENNTLSFVIGSRIAKLGTNITRKTYRHYFGRIIATLIDCHLKLMIYDTQCGAKLMTHDLAHTVFEKPFISRWLFEVEIFSRMIKFYGREKVKKTVFELPLLEWNHVSGSKISFIDIIRIPYNLLRIRLKYNI